MKIYQHTKEDKMQEAKEMAQLYKGTTYYVVKYDAQYYTHSEGMMDYIKTAHPHMVIIEKFKFEK